MRLERQLIAHLDRFKHLKISYLRPLLSSGSNDRLRRNLINVSSVLRNRVPV